MKEAYIYKNDKVVVADIKENKCIEVKYSYQDNIENILKTENIIEYLDDIESEIKTEIQNIESKLKTIDNLIPSLIASWLYYSLLSMGFGTILGLFTNVWIIVWGMPLLISLICVITGVCNGVYYNILTRKKTGFKLELQKLNEELSKNKTYLEKLKKDKKATQEKIDEISKKFNYVEYKEKLSELKKLLETYRLIGKNLEVYKKYYKMGILEEKLNNKFEDSQVKLIKRYMEKNK